VFKAWKLFDTLSDFPYDPFALKPAGKCQREKRAVVSEYEKSGAHHEIPAFFCCLRASIRDIRKTIQKPGIRSCR